MNRIRIEGRPDLSTDDEGLRLNLLYCLYEHVTAENERFRAGVYMGRVFESLEILIAQLNAIGVCLKEQDDYTRDGVHEKTMFSLEQETPVGKVRYRATR